MDKWLGNYRHANLIESAGNLACLANRVNEGYNYAGVYFKLTTNLNLAGELDSHWYFDKL
jgi:hypothetical protein